MVLEGNIIRQVGHELYEFRDSSGTVYVDIDNKYWMGQTASPADKIHIKGEVDRGWDGIKIDVKKHPSDEVIPEFKNKLYMRAAPGN